MKIGIKGHASMFAANAIWGVMSPIAKFVMISGTITPLALTNLRIAGAMMLFWLVSLFTKPEHVESKDLAKLFGASLLAIIFNQGCFITGLGMTSPTNASIITTSMPLWAMILAAFFLKEPITGKTDLEAASPGHPRCVKCAIYAYFCIFCAKYFLSLHMLCARAAPSKAN